ncbi:MAG TPA: triple tyrosine motif-containing protein [Bacteroidia bacterium]|nr:triple tyrosine motif-containing protein [Bacteroidia bacterium]
MQLKYFQNTMSFEFAALNYVHADENEYAYKMEGMDTSWVYCGKRRFVTYSNISPGNILCM